MIPFMRASDEAQSDRRRVGRGRLRRMGRMAKKVRAKRFFRKLECNALKGHDSRVNKRVKSAPNACRTHAERLSNACRTRTEWRRMGPEWASLHGRPGKSKCLAPTASRRPAV